MKRYFNVTNSAGSIQRGYDERGWAALLSGDIDTALKAEGRFLDPTTGEPFPDDQQAEIGAALAAAREAHASQPRPPAAISVTARTPKANTGNGGLFDPKVVAARYVGPRGDGSETSIHVSVAPNAPAMLRDLVSGLVQK